MSSRRMQDQLNKYTLIVVTLVIGTVLGFLLSSCGSDKPDDKRTYNYDQPKVDDTDKRIKDLETQILALQGTSAQIDNLIQSDFATCPVSGNTADSLINQICKISQAANVEQIIATKGMLATINQSLTEQINAINDSIVTLDSREASDIQAINTQITTISGQIATINTTLTTLGTRMTNAETAITALQTLTNSINQTVNGTMTSFDIGTENLSAGPVYESVLRMVDKSRINAYVEAYGSMLSLPNNCANSTNGSPDVTITMTAHGLVVNDLVHLQGIAGSNGFTNGDIIGDFVVKTVPTVNTFVVTLRRNATSNGNFGGSSGLPVAYKVIGRGMGTVWKTADGADIAVRVTTVGTKHYNWLVKSTGFVCYDKTNNAATFATIIANGVNIVCK